ncbi:MAG: zinc ribbon domain-containing protein [Bacilli bacterium]|nr:zinc ribbon domain-containing protein [Bacilli bacterium]
MEMRRCPYCGSELDMEDTTCPFCGAHVGHAEVKAKGPSKPTYQSSVKASGSSNWVEEWKRKTLIGRIIAFFVCFGIVFGVPMLAVGPTFFNEPPTKEVCDYTFNWSTYSRNTECHIEHNQLFDVAISCLIFVLVFAFIGGLLMAFCVKYEHKKLGGSDVVVYRGMFKVRLLIDGKEADTGTFWTRYHKTLYGTTADGQSLSVIVPYGLFRSFEYITGGTSVN